MLPSCMSVRGREGEGEREKGGGRGGRDGEVGMRFKRMPTRVGFITYLCI
jgi:hypothetical protein